MHASAFWALIGIGSHSKKVPLPFLLGRRVPGCQNLLHQGLPGPGKECSYQEVGP